MEKLEDSSFLAFFLMQVPVNRVSQVVADHDKFLIQWIYKYINANSFWYKLLWTLVLGGLQNSDYQSQFFMFQILIGFLFHSCTFFIIDIFENYNFWSTLLLKMSPSLSAQKYFKVVCNHTCKNLIPMVVTRAMANFSKNHALLMSRIWKMG